MFHVCRIQKHSSCISSVYNLNCGCGYKQSRLLRTKLTLALRTNGQPTGQKKIRKCYQFGHRARIICLPLPWDSDRGYVIASLAMLVFSLAGAVYIRRPPKHQRVRAGQPVTFVCQAGADTLLDSTLTIRWRKDGERLDFRCVTATPSGCGFVTSVLIGQGLPNCLRKICFNKSARGPNKIVP